MGAVKPRQGRFSVILPGMLVYTSYLSLLILGRESLASNTDSGIGLWWVHLIFGLLVALYLFKNSLQVANTKILFFREHEYFKYFVVLVLILILLWIIS